MVTSVIIAATAISWSSGAFSQSGGGGVLAALSQGLETDARIKAALSIYPACDGLRSWASVTRVWIWYAGGDLIQPPSQCRPAVDASEDQISERTFPGVHHGFDTRGLPEELEPGQPALAYDVDAAEALWQEIESILLSLR